MKKIIGLLFVIMISFNLVSCSSSNTNTTSKVKNDTNVVNTTTKTTTTNTNNEVEKVVNDTASDAAKESMEDDLNETFKSLGLDKL